MMKKCFEDKDLLISKDPFERPDNLSIKVDCWSPRKVETDSTALPPEEEQNTEEFGL
jgi:penicillin-binding protein 1A